MDASFLHFEIIFYFHYNIHNSIVFNSMHKSMILPCFFSICYSVLKI